MFMFSRSSVVAFLSTDLHEPTPRERTPATFNTKYFAVLCDQGIELNTLRGMVHVEQRYCGSISGLGISAHHQSRGRSATAEKSDRVASVTVARILTTQSRTIRNHSRSFTPYPTWNLLASRKTGTREKPGKGRRCGICGIVHVKQTFKNSKPTPRTVVGSREIVSRQHVTEDCGVP